jgi:hypothetical protein
LLQLFEHSLAPHERKLPALLQQQELPELSKDWFMATIQSTQRE